MYVPSHFAEDQLDVLHQLMHEHPLGTLNACHIPFEIAPASAAAPHGTLRAHLARNNTLWRNASAALDALVVFQGPQAYITPSLYAEKKMSGKVVPTYDYTSVHAYGPFAHHRRPRMAARAAGEPDQAPRGEPRPAVELGDAPPDYIEKMLAAIIGIEIPLSRVIGSWKASQNRSDADRITITAGLRASGAADAMAMAGLVVG
ncbi:MAG: FMN-binding negative transcriptional regulator [Burkholderiaceae bacterium]